MFADVVEVVGGASDCELLVRLREVEDRRRADAAEEAVLLAELNRRWVFRRDGHATMWGLLRALSLQLTQILRAGSSGSTSPTTTPPPDPE